MDEAEEFEFRARAEREAAAPPAAPPAAAAPIDPANAIGGVMGVHKQARPATDAGQRVLEGLDRAPYDAGGAVTDALAPYVPPGIAGGAGYLANVGTSVAEGMIGPPGARVARTAAEKAPGAIKSSIQGIAERAGLGGGKPPMAGGGAAMTDKGRMVMERAANLPHPLKPTKAAVTFGPERFEQTQFERETAKGSPAGKPLLERGAENNESLIKNFDAWIDQTGAEAPELRATGAAVDKALASKMKKAKATYQAAFHAAEKSGEMAQLVGTEDMVNFVKENASAKKLAPIVQAAEDEMVRLGGAKYNAKGELIPGAMRINDVETMRKLLVKLSKADETNGHFGRLANEVIDKMTEGKGGENYAKARSLFKRYADEFKNTGVIKKLVSTKPGSNDRAVALEDVFQHSILGSASLDDVRNVRKTLQTEGDLGQQAWKELQGQTLNYLKEQAIGGAARDVRGNPIVSFSKLDKAVTNLDKDGKLDFIFGKQGAQKLRDVRDLAADVITAPPGSVNYSNSASALKKALGELMHFKLAGIGTVVGVGKDAFTNYKTGKRVQEALNPQSAADQAGIAGMNVFRPNRPPAP